MNTRRLGAWLLTAMSIGWTQAPLIAFAGPPQGAPAGAPASSDDAAKLKAAGDEAMTGNNYQDALDDYQAAYKITKSPALLYNQGRALQALNRLPEALDMITAFDRQAPPDLKAKVPKLAELKADLENRVAKLVLEVNETGASVKLGDRVLGVTPLGEIRVNVGSAKLEISKEGFGTEVRSIKLEANHALQLKIDLVPKDKSGLLVVTSPVKGAHVIVDGKPVGDVPSEVRLVAGSHRVTFQARGYDDDSVEVITVAGQTKNVEGHPSSSPFYKQGWFWGTTVGVVAAAGIAVAIAVPLTTTKSPDRGTIDPGIVPVRMMLRSPTIHF